MIPLLLTGAVLVGLLTYQSRQHPQWAARGIHPIIGWRPVALTQVGTGLAATALLAPQWGTPAAVAAAAFAWLSVLAITTDLATRKVPWDVSYPVAAVGIVAFALDYTFEGALAAGAALLGVVGVPLLARALTRKGLGASDVRILFAATATTSWWVGQTWLLYALMMAALGQSVVRLFAPRLGWGARVPVPHRRTHTTGAVDLTSQPDDGPDAEGSPASAPVRTRLELPFAPALLISIWALIAYATYTGQGACEMWNPFGCGR